jgi:hypothetical protein
MKRKSRLLKEKKKMKTKLRAVNHDQLFSESCQVDEMGARRFCKKAGTKGHSCTPTGTRSEARSGAPDVRARVLQEDWRAHYRGTDVRELVPEGARMIPMTTQDADAILSKHGLTRPRDTKPLSLHGSAPHRNALRLQEARGRQARHGLRGGHAAGTPGARRGADRRRRRACRR